ncbi:MAG: ArdC-like ssDNA-binding domain-containing protein, partial [Gaiellaceae bacterium]
MATKSRRRLSDQEREERRERGRQQLMQATEQLLSSDGWQRWVRVRSRNGLSRYSVNNQLIIALSKPEASYVCGFRAWLQLGYQVRKGEKAISILAPMPVKNRDATNTEDAEKPRVFFRAVPVFDRTQVDAIEGTDPAPLEPPCEPLTGESHRHLLEPLHAFAASLGYSVSFAPIPGSTGGWCDHDAKRVAVDASQPVNAQVRILVHELAHALGIGYREYGRHQAEVIVDTVTFIVCAGAGLDVGGESIPYVAGWGENGALDAVTKFAGVIDTIVRQLENVIAATEDT